MLYKKVFYVSLYIFLFSKRFNLLYRVVICHPNIAPHSSSDWIKLLERLNRYRAWSGVWSTVSSNQSQDRNADEAHVNHAILSSRHHRPHPMETPRAGFARFKAYYIFSLHPSPSSLSVFSLFYSSSPFLTVSITYPHRPFPVTIPSSFYLSSSLCLFPSVLFDYSLSLSSLTPDDSSYCRTTPQPPYIRSHAMG